MITGINDFTGMGLYVHVPFCLTRCSYCGFYSTVPDCELVDKYLVQLEIEAQKRLTKVASEVFTIFIGGGNPMCLGYDGLKRLIGIIMDQIDAQNIKEWTFEANPESMTTEIAALLAELPGIRISLGVQRLRDEELTILGRQAKMEHVYKAMEICLGKFENISADFILGVPGCKSLANDLSLFLEKFSLKHISAYFLSIEQDSQLKKRIDCGEFPNPDDCGPEEMFEVKEVLETKGFEQYEISNYSLAGFRCLHNMNYWKPGDYIGMGPSAVSTKGALRQSNVADIHGWLSDEKPVFEHLSSIDSRNEYLMLRLRLISDGLNLSNLEKRFGAQAKSFHTQLQFQIVQGNIEKSGNMVKLTNKGITFADNVMSCLFL